MAECDVQQLLQDGDCFGCLTVDEQIVAELQLLKLASGTSMSVQELLEAGKCFACLTDDQMVQVEAQLLCEVLGGA